ncbi:erythromycin esterase family protein, partial [Bacillus sp. SM2101]|uniref:erythromycin esterase family protein n=1 Tax=Bacillus sp. SM2101 TaxID=2805366 RepID=UPI001BDDF746
MEQEYLSFVSSTYWKSNFPENWQETRRLLTEKYNDLLYQLNQGESDKFENEDEKQLFIKIIEQRIKSLNRKNTNEFRDKIMADNLVWLLEEMFPDEKFIIWGHNVHIMKNRSIIKIDPYEPFKNMVENLPEEIKEQSYIVGLYMYSGKNTDNDRKIYDISTEHKTNSIEYHLNQPGYSVSFLNIDIEDDEKNTYWWNAEATSQLWGANEETFIPSEQY